MRFWLNNFKNNLQEGWETESEWFTVSKDLSGTLHVLDYIELFVLTVWPQ